MNKSSLKNIIKEVLLEEKGYSRYSPGGTTSGLTKNTLDKILLRIAKGEDLEGDSEERGNKILDKANPENVARIIRGEKPEYNEELDRMQELAGIQSEIKVNSPNLIKFEDLEEGEVYNFTYDDGNGEKNDDLKVITNDFTPEDGDFIIVNHLDLPDMEDSFELYPNEITAIRKG